MLFYFSKAKPMIWVTFDVYGMLSKYLKILSSREEFTFMLYFFVNSLHAVQISADFVDSEG